jgi:hypothetical protein
MSKVEVDPEKVRDEILSVSEPSISKQDYQDKVERLARQAMEDYPEEYIHDIVFAVVDEYIDSADNQTQADILHHSQSNPYDLKPFIEGSYSDGVLSGLSFIHLERDVWRGVWSRKRDSMEDLVDELLDEYSKVSEIHVLHPPEAQSVNRLEVLVSTPDAQSVGKEPEKYQKHTFVEVEGGEDIGELGYPFEVKLSDTGSGSVGGYMGTTVYKEDGTKPSLTPEQGVLRLRRKMRGECPECGHKKGGSHA